MFSLSYLYSQAVFVDSPDEPLLEGNRFPQAPRHRAVAGVECIPTEDLLLFAQADFGSEQYAHPSRFLDEIPPGLVEGWDNDGGEADVLGEYVPDPSAGEGLAEGDLVEHDHFGRGRVELLVGAGANARATVRFEHHGSKMLLLQYARLRRVGRGGQR